MMFSEIGNLKNYWHAIALTSEIRKKRSLKRSLYSYPLLIWRDAVGDLHALVDCCAHKRAPIEVKDYTTNRIVCPYHGWEYDQDGNLVRVPSAIDACEKLKCTIPKFQLIDADGYVWIHLDLDSDSPQYSPPDFSNFSGPEWSTKFMSKVFDTDEELLIDNFMDATHTALVHDGLIRSSQESIQHRMTVTSDAAGVRVDFDETEEKIAMGLRLFFGGSMKVRHSDEFLFPNLVRVIYELNGTQRFMAFIACTPIAAGKTIALVQLRYRFGMANALASPAISLMAKKILKQDFQITQQQYLNRQRFAQSKDHLVAADFIPTRVSQSRAKLIAGECDFEEHVKVIEVTV